MNKIITINNIDKRLIDIVTEKYSINQLAIIDGQIYRIETIETLYDKYIIKCKLILWDLTLSKNYYIFEKFIETNYDGSYNYSYYKFKGCENKCD